MGANDNEGCLVPRGGHAFIASLLAPTESRKQKAESHRKVAFLCASVRA